MLEHTPLLGRETRRNSRGSYLFAVVVAFSTPKQRFQETHERVPIVGRVVRTTLGCLKNFNHDKIPCVPSPRWLLTDWLHSLDRRTQITRLLGREVRRRVIQQFGQKHRSTSTHKTYATQLQLEVERGRTCFSTTMRSHTCHHPKTRYRCWKKTGVPTTVKHPRGRRCRIPPGASPQTTCYETPAA